MQASSMSAPEFDPEMVEAVRDVLADGGCHGPCARDEPCLCRLDAEAVLRTLAARGALLPEGWVAVPREPTEAMLWAADRAHFTGEDDPDKPGFVLFGQTREEWAAMLAAAPRPGESA